MAPKSTKGDAAISLNPELMVAGGLPRDFDGVIREVRYVPSSLAPEKYQDALRAKNAKPQLMARVTIDADEESGFDTVTEFYSAGDLGAFAPSQDGVEPVDLDGEPDEMEGTYAVPVGKREAMNNNTNWAFFLTNLKQAGFTGFTASTECLEGISAFFSRPQPPSRPGLDQGEKKAGVLVVAELHGKKAGAAKAKGSAASKADTNGLDDRLSEIVLEALTAADGTIARTKLPGIVIKQFSGAQKAQAVKRVGDVKFLEGSELWAYDADEGTLTAV